MASVIRTALVVVGILVAGLWAITVHAAEGTDGVRGEIEQSILAGDSADGLTARLDAYRLAREKFQFLAQLDDGQDTPEAQAARSALESLAQDGVTSDVLTTTVLSTIIALVKDGGADDEAMEQYRVDFAELPASLSSPELRASSYLELSEIHAAHDVDAALSYVGRALDEAASIEELESKNSVLNAVAQAADRLAAAGAQVLLDRAIASMSPSGVRGNARYTIARADLAGTTFENATDSDLQRASLALVQSGDMAEALELALAIDPGAGALRSDMLDAVLAGALKGDHVELFEHLATSYTDEADQQRAIASIIDDRIESNRVVDAIPLAEKLPDGPMRARTDYVLAAALNQAGYATMAEEALAHGNKVVAALEGEQKQTTLGESVKAAVALGKLAEALEFAAEIEDVQQASSAMRRLGKALADAGQVEDAETVYARLADPDDRDYALSGIAKARVATGDLSFGIEALNVLVDSANRGRVQSELARQYAKRDAFDDAFDVSAQIDDHAYRIDALVRLADAAIDGEASAAAKHANDLALEAVAAVDDPDDRDALLIKVIESLAKAGDLETARGAVQRISDDNDRAKALGIVAWQVALNGDARGALEAMDSVASTQPHSADVAAALVAIAADPAFVEEAVSRVRAFTDDRLRTQTLRLIAEAQLRRLDLLDLGSGEGLSRDYLTTGDPEVTPATAQVEGPLFAAGGLEMLRVAGHPQNFRDYGFPSLAYGAADIRRAVPMPKAGSVGVTLAHLSPYSDKFLEDLAGGESGMSYAAKSQGLLSPRLIVIESGVYTLGSLVKELAGTGGERLVSREGDAVTLRAPLLVAAGATLILSGQEASTYRLSADAGAFVSVAGTLFIIDTVVTSWDDATQSPRPSDKSSHDAFRPFIVGWSGADLSIGGSVLDSLGYAAPKAFGLSFSSGPKNVADLRDLPAPTGHVVDNLFHNFEYGFYSYEAEDVFLVGNEYKDSVVYGVDPHDRSKRLVIALNTAYGTKSKHGIIISREVDGSWIVGNVAFDNAGSGFMLDRDSTDTLIYANVAYGNQQDGLTLFESSCNIATANHFFDNRRAGIKIRNSWDVGLFHNYLEANGGFAIDGYTSRIEETSEARNFVEDPYVALTTFAAGNNVIAGNGAGINTRGVSAFSLFGQDFKGQRGPLLAGDARAFEGHMLRFNGANDATVVSSVCPAPRPAYHCGLRNSGILSGDGLDLAFASSGRSQCIAQSALGAVTFAPSSGG